MPKQKESSPETELHDTLRELIAAWQYLDDMTDDDTLIECRAVSTAVQKALRGQSIFIPASEFAAQIVDNITRIAGDKYILYEDAYYRVDPETGALGIVSPPAEVLNLEK